MYKLNSFKIANFRSFFDEQKLNFEKTNITAIYGSNASGKSNTARALNFMKWFVFNSAKAEIVKIPFEPFLLRSDNDLPSAIEIEFQNHDRSFRYSFSFNADEIVSEDLIELTSQKEKVIFKRRRQNIDNIATARKIGFTDNLLKKTRKTTLLVTKAREDNNSYANLIFDFLSHFNVITCGTPELRQISVDLLAHDSTMKNKVLDFLRSADFWIRDIKVDEIDTPDEVIKNLPFTEDFKKNFQKSVSITTTHSIRDKNSRIVSSAQFSLDSQESAGTGVIFDLSALIIHTLEQKSSLYIDEFGLHLHPDICHYILQQFKNNAGSQLILNTHDGSLMDYLAREDIAFVDKNQAEESYITPLTNLSPRTNDPFEKHYRKGLYGARPIIKGLK